MSFTIYTYTDSHHNTISYLFNPSKRESDGSGPVVLERVTLPYQEDPSSPPPPAANEPKPGTILLRYIARDGGDVRYIYDPTASNGKQYVVAIHREPGNWQRLREEDLGVRDEEGLRRAFEERKDGRDDGRDKVHEAREEAHEARKGEDGQERESRWARERQEDVERSKRRDSMVDDGELMDIDLE
ncbi:hypothetical protein DM02DRAFT_633865 [Periconia macrospinosa]|uniref:Uncharacterized protein n=1 Tax=Periconia macrospinosa TaxID=97972 RepID=A0A2V1DAR2_9PLEO|nr:hypothetical protein DM02DRAFT_633865 [Periconia macrospinosa]